MNGLKFDQHNNFTKNFARNLLVFIATIMVMSPALANPVLGNVASGGATITQTPNTTHVLQTTQKAIINWNSFNIGAQQSTSFIQPAGGVALNRISPTQGPSQIFGMLSATGTIILVNQAGIFFGPSAHVDVNGLIASTSDISNKNFLNGVYRFNRPSTNPNASIINQGRIIARQNGLVALVGNNVENDGFIRANLGNVVLASGSKFTVSFDNDQMINFTINQGASRGSSNKAAVINKGTIVANGGNILLTAEAARGVLDNAIDMQGVAIAKSIHQQGGEIILSGGDGLVTVASAKLIVSGRHHGQTGGLVQISGRNIVVKGHTKIDVSGDAGGGKILIGSNNKSPTSTTSIGPQTILLADALTQGNGGIVSILSTDATSVAGQISAKGGANSGNGGSVETSGSYLNVNGATINLLAPHGQTGTWLLDPTNIYIAANQTDATTAGMTGTDSSANTETSNTFQATGTVPDSLLTTGTLDAALNTSNILVTTTNSSGTGLGNITVVDPITWTAATTLSLTAANNIAINANIYGTSNGAINGTPTGGLILTAGSNSKTITATGNIAVANFDLAKGAWSQNTATLPSSPSFTASNNFTIASGASFLRVAGGSGTAGSPYQITDVYGLQGIATQPLSNSYILNNTIDATVTQNWNSGAGFVPIGTSSTPFTGNFNGAGFTINNLYINTPSLTLAGLFGNANLGSNTIQGIGVTNANIKDSDASASGTGILAGELSSGTISNSYATGAVNGTRFVGGLVGVNNGTITNSYNAAAVTGASQGVGGIAGENENNILYSYNTGSVTVPSVAQFATAYLGGLVGINQGVTGNIKYSYNTGTVTGIAGTNTTTYAGGLVGINRTNSVISTSYNLGTVNLNSQFVYFLGGLVGENDSQVIDTYSAGNVIGSGSGGVPGGFIGNNTGQIFSSYWDTAASGRSVALGSNTGSITGGLTGGCFGSSSCSGGGNVDLTNQSTFSSWAFDANDWGIIPGQSYPYLQPIFPTTPRAISGTANVGANNTVQFAVNGQNLPNGPAQSSAQTEANQFYYAIEPSGAIADNSNILLYLTSGGTANTIVTAPTSGGSITGLNLSTNTVSVNGNGSSFSNTILGTTAGSINPSYLLYSVSGSAPNANLTLGNNVNFVTSSSTPYVIDGTITQSGGSGSLTFNGAVTLTAANAVLTAGGPITFNSTIDGTSPLSLTSSSNTLNSAVGSGTALSSLTLSGGGTDAVNAGVINTTGFQTYNDAVNLGAANTALTAGGPITFNSTIDGASTLSLTSSSNILNGAVGSGAALSSLTLSGGGTDAINAGAINTTGSQMYNDAVNLGADTTLTAGGPITFNSTIDGASLLSLSSSSNTLNGAIGHTTPLTSLTLSGGGTDAINGGTINTTGFQTYNDAVNLGAANTTLTAGGPITFNSTIDGASTLSLSSSGNTLNGAIGSGAALSSLTLSGGGTDAINSGVINTTGFQTYNDAVNLGAANTTLTAGGPITFNSTMDGASTLSLSSSSNTLNGAIGSGAALSSLTLSGGGTDAINAGVINTTGFQTYNDAVNLGAANTTLTAGGGPITFNSTIDGASTLSLSSSSNTLNGAIGSGTALSSLNLSGGGTDAINGGAITTTGSQIYNDNVNLGTNTALTGNTAITLANGVTGGTNLSLANNTSNTAFTLAGNLLLNNVSVNGVTGTNSLAVQTGSPTQNWTLSGPNSGLITVTGTGSQITGLFTFGGIQSLMGGNGSKNELIGNNSTTNAFSIAGLYVGSVIDPINFSNFNTFYAGTPTNSNNDTVTFATGLDAQGTVSSPSLITVTINNGMGPMFFNDFGKDAFANVTFPSAPVPPTPTPVTPTIPTATPSAADIAAVNNTIVGQTTITETTTTTNSWQDNLMATRYQQSVIANQEIATMLQTLQNEDVESYSKRQIYPNCGGRAS